MSKTRRELEARIKRQLTGGYRLYSEAEPILFAMLDYLSAEDEAVTSNKHLDDAVDNLEEIRKVVGKLQGLASKLENINGHD